MGEEFRGSREWGIIFPCRLAVNDSYAAALAHEAASREMLEHYSHVRQQAKRRAVEALDNVTITARLGKWEAVANQRIECEKAQQQRSLLVGTGRFELPTPRTPSECS